MLQLSAERGRTHQRADKDTFVHRSANEMCDEPRNNNEKEDFHHAPCARHRDDPCACITFLEFAYDPLLAYCQQGVIITFTEAQTLCQRHRTMRHCI